MKELEAGTRVKYRHRNIRLGLERGDRATVLGRYMESYVHVHFDKWDYSKPAYGSAMQRKRLFGMPAYCLDKYDFDVMPCMFDGVET
jgi:hypothetical protein